MLSEMHLDSWIFCPGLFPNSDLGPKYVPVACVVWCGVLNIDLVL